MNVSQIKKIPASSTTKIVNTIFLLQTTPTHKEQEDIFSVCVSYKLTPSNKEEEDIFSVCMFIIHHKYLPVVY